MKDIADQADPQKVVTHFEKLAKAAKSTIATNIPAALLPALVKLAGTVKKGADIQSLPYNPSKIAGFHVYEPNLRIMRQAAAKAIANSTKPAAATPASSPNASSSAKAKRPGTSASSSATASSSSGGATSLKHACG
jgi:hypothetical protein